MNKQIPFTDSNGIDYILSLTFTFAFDQFTSSPVVDVVFQPKLKDKLLKSNIHSVKLFLKKNLLDLLNNNPKAILYYYADNAPIFMNEGRINKEVSPEDFRHNLFIRMISGTTEKEIIYKSISEDLDETKHRICIFTLKENAKQLDEFYEAIYNYISSNK